MNKKEYVAPEILVEEFETEEIMTGSTISNEVYAQIDVDVQWNENWGDWTAL